MIHYYDIRPGSPLWYEWITASQVAGVCGLDPYRSRAETWRRRQEKTSPPMSEAMIWGNLHEEDALDKIRHILGIDLYVNRMLCANDKLPFLAATPDAFTIDDEPIEVKCPFFSRDTYETPPLHYLVQIMVQMAICEKDTCIFASWTPWDFSAQRICFSREMFRAIYAEVAEFAFLTEEPPRFKRGEKAKRNEFFASFPLIVETLV